MKYIFYTKPTRKIYGRHRRHGQSTIARLPFLYNTFKLNQGVAPHTLIRGVILAGGGNITCPSLGFPLKLSSDFRISGQSLIKENCHNSRTSDDIDMKLGPVTKLDKKNKATSKKLTMMSCRQIVTSLSFSQFLANLEQSGSRIPDA